ncbi:tRNA (adenosine(37)-N6)-threonylcarbamoyltransferase complex dimerization subunit type 1 TsaB [Haliea sp. E1-2-M8]|uniref:tRNA (adenosine(37)-N6)-threonylcarbamoyltransferase complex dimerization subunit type 1 TsaB n=1 Tax=Haliea sp. E1-2-M8 TaxID=3064706 RepID=UPI00271F1BE8|nr:tRNA (adenosine(37)-N6)-threonylcarbamoyltransferase complex dimerization subunit type 1 TsaB [Haliea sp. E1-2-M8]MDO8860779.1 tRNA (adenosine(37)-N6)-threonylcarbamoyltransferase complex dimerization subunit type 1 TsaB [Haliea sp. E1-2-M8]
MTSILAVDTSTEACSVALYRDGEVTALQEIAPRRHNQLLLAMLRELMPAGPDALDAVAYGSGPGSFTGLRIAASAVQGLCFATGLPALPVSTLCCQVYGAIRLGQAGEGDYVLSTVDAHIGELYWALYRIDKGRAVEIAAAQAVKPGLLAPSGSDALIAIGGGLKYRDAMPPAVTARFNAAHPDLLPDALDVLPEALRALQERRVQSAEQVCPVYVRDEISWKKLDQQGPQA